MSFVTADELAEIFAVDRSTVYRWVNLHHLPAYRLGGVVRFKMDEVEVWVSGHSVGREALATPQTPATPGRVDRLRAAVSSRVPAK